MEIALDLDKKTAVIVPLLMIVSCALTIGASRSAAEHRSSRVDGFQAESCAAEHHHLIFALHEVWASTKPSSLNPFITD